MHVGIRIGMRTSKINQNYFMNSPFYQKSNYLSGFGSSPKKDVHKHPNSSSEEEARSRFVSLSDDDLMYMASIQPNKRFQQVDKNFLKTLFIAVPSIDILSTAIFNNNGLAGKLAKGAQRTGLYAGGLALGIALGLGKHFVNSKVEKLDNFNEKHGILSTGIDIAVLLSAFKYIKNNGSKLKNTVKSTFTDSIRDINLHLVSPMKNAINNSRLNKKVIIPLQDTVLKQFKGNTKILQIFASSLVPIVGIAACLKWLDEAGYRKNSVKNNFNMLKAIQNMEKEDLGIN